MQMFFGLVLIYAFHATLEDRVVSFRGNQKGRSGYPRLAQRAKVILNRLFLLPSADADVTYVDKRTAKACARQISREFAANARLVEKA